MPGDGSTKSKCNSALGIIVFLFIIGIIIVILAIIGMGASSGGTPPTQNKPSGAIVNPKNRNIEYPVRSSCGCNKDKIGNIPPRYAAGNQPPKKNEEKKIIKAPLELEARETSGMTIIPKVVVDPLLSSDRKSDDLKDFQLPKITVREVTSESRSSHSSELSLNNASGSAASTQELRPVAATNSTLVLGSTTVFAPNSASTSTQDLASSSAQGSTAILTKDSVSASTKVSASRTADSPLTSSTPLEVPEVAPRVTNFKIPEAPARNLSVGPKIAQSSTTTGMDFIDIVKHPKHQIPPVPRGTKATQPPTKGTTRNFKANKIRERDQNPATYSSNFSSSG
jgi:hypothetical protein